MTVRSTHLKLIGAAGAAALAVGTLASPALAASTASASYTCATPLGPAHASAVYNAATAPAKMAVGQPLATTGTFTLDAGTTLLAEGLGWSQVKGTLTTKPSGSKAGLKMSFPKTTLGNGAGGSTVANATGSILAGSVVKSTFTFNLGDIGKVSLTGFGTTPGTVTFPNSDGTFGACTNDATTTTLMDGATPVTTQVVKDTTKTKESASYAAKKKVAKSSAKVTSRYGTPATGKVKFTLKKGTHKVKTLSSKLNKKGVAKVVFKGVKAKGKYSITAKYAGSKSLKGSSGKDTFRVK
jgi:hypothetical protein